MAYLITYNWRGDRLLSRIWPPDWNTALRHFERLAANPDASNVTLHEDKVIAVANPEPAYQ